MHPSQVPFLARGASSLARVRVVSVEPVAFGLFPRFLRGGHRGVRGALLVE